MFHGSFQINWLRIAARFDSCGRIAPTPSHPPQKKHPKKHTKMEKKKKNRKKKKKRKKKKRKKRRKKKKEEPEDGDGRTFPNRFRVVCSAVHLSVKTNAVAVRGEMGGGVSHLNGQSVMTSFLWPACRMFSWSTSGKTVRRRKRKPFNCLGFSLSSSSSTFLWSVYTFLLPLFKIISGVCTADLISDLFFIPIFLEAFLSLSLSLTHHSFSLSFPNGLQYSSF